MGLAVIVDQENCLSYQGLRCEVCYRVCPLIDRAIKLETRHNARTGKPERVGRLVQMHANQQTQVETASAGEIVAVQSGVLRLRAGHDFVLPFDPRAARYGRIRL